ncbi:MAG: EmrB/QacA subfamily drug resistance transporter [Candidatus Kaiserbacteria bacterium]|nr:EmrB/QacA subfamily drug resistance transporter [Candidatus Kaiserbacteria bacterium]
MEHSSKQRWYDLAILAIAQFMIVLDVSIVNVALPSMQADLGLSISDLQGIVTAYTLAFGGFLLLGGRAADLYGRKRMFLTGIACFTVMSLVIGIADNAALLVPLRALQGLAAAFMSPAALSLVLSIFTDSKERSKALSVWGAVSAGGATAGLLIGGVLTQYLNWRWNFFVNVPVGLGVFLVAWQMLPAHTAEESSKTLDLPGAILATSGMMLLVYSLSHGNTWGWLTFTTLGYLFLSVVLLLAFIYNESVVAHPLMPLSFFRIGNVAAALGVQLPVTASMFAMFFFLSIYVQSVLHYSPLETGFAFLPVTLMIGVIATQAPRAIRAFGYRKILVVAPFFLATGLILFTYTTIDSTYLHILPGLLIMPIGLGLSFVSITIAATSGVPGRESGLASGLLTTAQQIGGSLGLAIFSGIAAAATSTSLREGNPIGVAQIDGFHGAYYAGVICAMIGATVAYAFIRTVRTSPESAESVALH